MHRSRFSSLVIDCQTEDLTAAAKFWSQALGKPVTATFATWSPDSHPRGLLVR